MEKDKKDLDYKELFYYTNLVFNLSFTVVFTILAGGAVGYLLDKILFKSIGACFVSGLLLGIVAAFYSAYKLIMKKEFFPDEKHKEIEKK